MNVFACGADIKSRFSFFNEGGFLFSSERSDLSDPVTFSLYLKEAYSLKERIGEDPDIVVHDLHPLYFSSKVREIFPKSRYMPVQHHHAHIAAALSDAELLEPVIGVSFDGTGFGLDSNIWGGEFLLVESGKFKRLGHFKYVRMPGMEMAAREPWRMAFSLLYDLLGDAIFEKKYAFLKLKSRMEYLVLKSALDRNINVALSSSCGRLFDAISSILGITHQARYEAEAAINLEEQARCVEVDSFYNFDIAQENGAYCIEYSEFLRNFLVDLEHGLPIAVLSRRFHNSIAQVTLKMVGLISRDTGAREVALSGGCFQNKILCERTKELLSKAGFFLRENSAVPVNDLGICVGQTYVALAAENAEINRCV